MSKVFVKPADGRNCYTPSGAKLAIDGEFVTFSTYWRRRVADGSAVISEPPAKTAKAVPAPVADAGEDAATDGVETTETTEAKPKRSRKSKTGADAGEE